MRWCRADIWSCKLFVKVSLMLDSPFLVPSLCKLNNISVCSIQISTKLPANSLFPSRKPMFFWSHPRCFGPLSKFQHNIKISIKISIIAFGVCRLSVSCDDLNLNFHRIRCIARILFESHFAELKHYAPIKGFTLCSGVSQMSVFRWIVLINCTDHLNNVTKHRKVHYFVESTNLCLSSSEIYGFHFANKCK